MCWPAAQSTAASRREALPWGSGRSGHFQRLSSGVGDTALRCRGSGAQEPLGAAPVVRGSLCTDIPGEELCLCRPHAGAGVPQRECW